MIFQLRIYTLLIRDFSDSFDGDSWTINWRKKSNQLANLTDGVSYYNKNIIEKTKEEFKKEMDQWIEEEIQVLWYNKVSIKNRPVLDYLELNQFVKCRTGDDVIMI